MLERRDFLRSAAAATAFAGPTLPASSADLGATGPEAELDAAFARYMASYETAVTAEQRALAAYRAVKRPEIPAAALCQAGDGALGLTNNVWEGGIQPGQVYRDCSALQHATHMKGFYVPSERGHAAAVRAEEILAALKAHTDAVIEAEKEGAYPAADRADLDAMAVERVAAEALAKVQVATLRGLLVKARAVALYERNAEALQDWRDEATEHHCAATQLAVSLTLDLIRMSGPA